MVYTIESAWTEVAAVTDSFLNQCFEEYGLDEVAVVAILWCVLIAALSVAVSSTVLRCFRKIKKTTDSLNHS